MDAPTDGDTEDRELAISEDPHAPRLITRIAPQKHDPARVSIYLDGRFAFGLAADLVLLHSLAQGQRLDAKKEREIRNEALFLRAKEIALNFLSYQARTTHEVAKKLRDHEFPEALIEKTLQRFQELGYLDDARFARQYAERCLTDKGWGAPRIQLALRKKGITPDDLQPALESISEKQEVFDALLPHALRRWERLQKEPTPHKRRAKLFSFLQRRGCPLDTLHKLAEYLEQHHPHAPDNDAETPDQEDTHPTAPRSRRTPTQKNKLTRNRFPSPQDDADTSEDEGETEEQAEADLDAMRQIAQKRWERLCRSESDPYKRRAKLAAYLQRQGCDFDHIRLLVKELPSSS
jgi:regulatory protein